MITLKELENTSEYMFKMDGQEYCVVRCERPKKRTYSLTNSRGYPWMTYAGTDRIAGAGLLQPATYAQADISGRRFLFSSGPWWVDGNHAPPGYGYLSLVFLCLLRPDRLHEMFFHAGMCYPVMDGMSMRGTIRGDNVDLKGADFVFWFQCYSEAMGKSVNYALVGQPLNGKLMDGNIHEFSFDIDMTKGHDWVCLGSCDEKSSMYGNLDIKDLDPDKPINMGFILVPIDVNPAWPDQRNSTSTMNLDFETQWPIDSASLPTGTIALYELDVTYESNYEILRINRS